MAAHFAINTVAASNIEWLSTNRTIFIEANIPVDSIVDDLIRSSQGSLFNPTTDEYQIINSQRVSCDKVRALLDVLTKLSVSTGSNAIPLFKTALARLCESVLAKCIEPCDNLKVLRCHLDDLYRQEYDEDKPFVWLDERGDQPYKFHLNTCIVEATEAERLMSRASRNATSEFVQERQDYLYSKPEQTQVVEMDTVFHITRPNDSDHRGAQPSSPAAIVCRRPATCPHKRVCVYGAAGCGKTALCVKVTGLYAHGQLWQHFSLVLFFRLRDQAVHTAEELWQLLLALLPDWSNEQCQQTALALLATNGHGVLVVLDGADELVANKNAYVRRLLSGDSLPQAHLFVTSRPCAAAKKYFLSYDVSFEVLGFTDQQVVRFTETRLGELAPRLNNFLSVNPQFASLMSVPLFALSVCEVFLMNPDHPPSTRSKLYSMLIALLVRRAVGDGRVFVPDDEYDDVMAAKDVSDFQGKAKDLLLELTNLAWLAHQANQDIFDRQLVKQAKCSNEALRLGLVTCKSGRASAQYSFLHLTFQEFLVAFAVTHRIETSKQSSRICHIDPIAVSPHQKELICHPNRAPNNSLTRFVHRLFRRQPERHVLVHPDSPVEETGNHQAEYYRPFSKLIKDLLDRNRCHAVPQFLAGLLSDDVLSTFLTSLNQWLHTYRELESEMEARSHYRLQTVLECLKEANADKIAVPTQVYPPKVIVLRHATAADISILAKAFDLSTCMQRLELSLSHNHPFRGHQQTRLALVSLMSSLKKRKCVRELHLSSQRYALFEKEAWTSLCQAVARTHLNTLHVFGCSLEDRECAELAMSLRDNTQMKVLTLTDNRIGDVGACELAKALKSNNSLWLLGLNSNRINNKGARKLASTLRLNSTLTQLSLNSNSITDEGACKFGAALRSNKALTQLSLSGNRISDNGARELAIALWSNRTLTQLFLYDNRIGDGGACALAVALKSNHTLTWLHLASNTIGDKGACEFAKALQSNKTLTCIHLDNNEIGGKGARRLLSVVLDSNHTLTQLQLSSDKIGDEIAHDLALALQANHLRDRDSQGCLAYATSN